MRNGAQLGDGHVGSLKASNSRHIRDAPTCRAPANHVRTFASGQEPNVHNDVLLGYLAELVNWPVFPAEATSEEGLAHSKLGRIDLLVPGS